MRLSARNQIKGKILEVIKGATTSHVRVEISPGQIVTASITNQAVEELGGIPVTPACRRCSIFPSRRTSRR